MADIVQVNLASIEQMLLSYRDQVLQLAEQAARDAESQRAAIQRAEQSLGQAWTVLPAGGQQALAEEQLLQQTARSSQDIVNTVEGPPTGQAAAIARAQEQRASELSQANQIGGLAGN